MLALVRLHMERHEMETDLGEVGFTKTKINLRWNSIQFIQFNSILFRPIITWKFIVGFTYCVYIKIMYKKTSKHDIEIRNNYIQIV